MANATVHFSPGYKSEIAVVLSCPGRHEERSGHPAAGNTGRNLERLLNIIGPHLKLPHLSRDQITITNAWPEVEYVAKTKRSEASNPEIVQAKNLDRLAEELQHISVLIIFCGAKARLASTKLLEDKLLHCSAQIGFLPHLGNQGLNKIIQTDLSGTPIIDARLQKRNGRHDSIKSIKMENANRRLHVAAMQLLNTRVSIDR